jgi:hypothetical protein
MAVLPDNGSPGHTMYAPPGVTLEKRERDADACELAETSPTGAVLFATRTHSIVVLPPFCVERAHSAEEIVLDPLFELLERRRSLGVFLLKRGGYTIGFLRGESVVDSKTGRRFVKNRHRKGGQSQRRFDRIREKQIHELFEAACGDARATLGRWEREIQHVFLGGDRLAIGAFRKECDYFERFGPKLSTRILTVAGDPRRITLDTIGKEIWASDVYRWTREGRD